MTESGYFFRTNFIRFVSAIQTFNLNDSNFEFVWNLIEKFKKQKFTPNTTLLTLELFNLDKYDLIVTWVPNMF